MGQDGSTSAKLTLENRSLKDWCANGLVLSVLLLSGDINERLTRIVMTVASPLKEWHVEQVKECRSCNDVCNWFIEQYGKGGFMKHLEHMISNLHSRHAMEACSSICTDKAYVFCL